MDHVTKKTRSKIMAAVHTRNTGAELALRSLVHRLGFRFALHRKDLPGKPDLVFVCRRRVIFVHGCFWHGHKCRYGRLPKSRIDYWQSKIDLNRKRDARQARELRRSGWSVLVVWQCKLKKPDMLRRRILEFLDN